EFLESYEKTYIQQVLNRNKQNISLTARDLGISRNYLKAKMGKYGLMGRGKSLIDNRRALF
ncbi:MAG: helix-turn-helix domain-containing protein, partial [bacterium]